MKSEILCVEVELTKNDAGRYRVRLSGDGFESVEDKFAFEVLANSQEKEKIGAIEEGTCDYEDLTYAGTRLWLGLMTGKCKTAWESLNQKRKVGDCVHLRLSLPAQPLSEDYPIDMRELPWEALYNPDVGSLAGDPNFCIIRQWRSETHIPELRSTAGRALRMLVIIPTASGLDAAQELTNIRHEGSKLAPPLEVEELVGAVTPNRLATTLENQDWDIVHFVGHGTTDKDGRVMVELNDANGNPEDMDAEIFVRDFGERNIRLAVLNCCEGGKVNPKHSLSGLGALLMREGIPAVVAMRYDIKDTLAIMFSQTFYQTLFNGKKAGRVDTALEAGRRMLLRNSRDTARGFITPVIHLAKGYEQLFTLTAPPPLPPKKTRRSAVQLPPTLEQAFRDGRCLPVIGPGILSAGAVRRSGAALLQNFGPQALAQSVAKDPLHPYPPAALTADFQLCASGGDWMSGLLMQWVCQHNVFKHTARATLIKALREIYSGLDPGDAVRKIAGWRVTATFYTFFDGLIESCVNREESPLNIILYGVQDALSASVGALAAKPRPLILVRGSLSNSDSLMLTEEDYEDLLENISQMPPITASLARQTGSSVVFLGVSPRDPLVHALARKILDPSTRRTHGPTFWVCPQPSEVDKAYWSRYAVEWIHHPTDQVIEALSDLKSS